MKISTIYCYYEHLGKDDDTKLVKMWRRAWEDQGWTAIVLSKADAQRHPKFDAVSANSKRFPTVNGKEFELACFIRWCAFSLISGAVTDYDVFPRVPFPPAEFPIPFCGDPCNGPGFLVGNQYDFNAVVDVIAGYTPTSHDQHEGKPHVSDLLILQRNPNLFPNVRTLQAGYGASGWDSVPLIHFGNAYMKTNLPRSVEVSLVMAKTKLKP